VQEFSFNLGHFLSFDVTFSADRHIKYTVQKIVFFVMTVQVFESVSSHVVFVENFIQCRSESFHLTHAVYFSD
jgi:hypothetical protein